MWKNVVQTQASFSLYKMFFCLVLGCNFTWTCFMRFSHWFETSAPCWGEMCVLSVCLWTHDFWGMFSPWVQMLEVRNTWSWWMEKVCVCVCMCVRTWLVTTLLKEGLSVFADKYHLHSWFKHTLETALRRFVLQNCFYCLFFSLR